MSLAKILRTREGHFTFESGHHGRLWLDLDALFVHPSRLRPLVADLAVRLAGHGVTAICGPATGGAYLAQQVALELNARFHPVERVPPGYRLAPGVAPGERIALVDDAINAGSAVRACLRELARTSGEVVALGALLTLGTGARDLAASVRLPLAAVETWPHELWEPADCPLCAQGLPLEST